ncbi:hypothetical protein [Providencia vermicola]|uniref:hypothetical protein n=1 Tax=Providencia vermicola TaxID=333965 RepID=UPI0034D7B09B
MGIPLKVIANDSFENDEVRLIIHSQIDRPILGFSINGVHGGNASAYGGSAATCCGIINGKIAVVKWTLDVTGDQFDLGMRPEKEKLNYYYQKEKKVKTTFTFFFYQRIEFH